MKFTGTWRGRFDYDSPTMGSTEFILRIRQNLFGRIEGEALDLAPEPDGRHAAIRGIAQGNVLTFRKEYPDVRIRTKEGETLTLDEWVQRTFDDTVAAGPETRVIDYRGVFTRDDDALAGRWNSEGEWVQLEKSREWFRMGAASGLWIAHRVSTEVLDEAEALRIAPMADGDPS